MGNPWVTHTHTHVKPVPVPVLVGMGTGRSCGYGNLHGLALLVHANCDYCCSPSSPHEQLLMVVLGGAMWVMVVEIDAQTRAKHYLSVNE
jgi:hypothetical protein